MSDYDEGGINERPLTQEEQEVEVFRSHLRESKTPFTYHFEPAYFKFLTLVWTHHVFDAHDIEGLGTLDEYFEDDADDGEGDYYDEDEDEDGDYDGHPNGGYHSRFNDGTQRESASYPRTTYASAFPYNGSDGQEPQRRSPRRPPRLSAEARAQALDATLAGGLGDYTSELSDSDEDDDRSGTASKDRSGDRSRDTPSGGNRNDDDDEEGSGSEAVRSRKHARRLAKAKRREERRRELEMLEADGLYGSDDDDDDVYDGFNTGTLDIVTLPRVLRELGFSPTYEDVERHLATYGRYKRDEYGNPTREKEPLITFPSLCDLIKAYMQDSEVAEFERELTRAFRVFDDDSEGYVDAQMIARALQFLPWRRETHIKDKIDELMGQLDPENEGYISYEYFISSLCKNFAKGLKLACGPPKPSFLKPQGADAKSEIEVTSSARGLRDDGADIEGAYNIIKHREDLIAEYEVKKEEKAAKKKIRRIRRAGKKGGADKDGDGSDGAAGAAGAAVDAKGKSKAKGKGKGKGGFDNDGEDEGMGAAMGEQIRLASLGGEANVRHHFQTVATHDDLGDDGVPSLFKNRNAAAGSMEADGSDLSTQQGLVDIVNGMQREDGRVQIVQEEEEEEDELAGITV